MTCHDRDVMNRIVTRIIEIDGGEVTCYTGDFDFYDQARDIVNSFRDHAERVEAAVILRARINDQVPRLYPPLPFRLHRQPRARSLGCRGVRPTRPWSRRAKGHPAALVR